MVKSTAYIDFDTSFGTKSSMIFSDEWQEDH